MNKSKVLWILQIITFHQEGPEPIFSATKPILRCPVEGRFFPLIEILRAFAFSYPSAVFFRFLHWLEFICLSK